MNFGVSYLILEQKMQNNLPRQMLSHQSSTILEAAIKALSHQEMGPLRVLSCISIGKMCLTLPKTETEKHAEAIVAGLMKFLSEAPQDLVHVALETLTAVIKVNNMVSSSLVSQVGPIVMQGWSNYINDPLVSTVVLEVFSAFASIPECQNSLHSFVIPAVASVLGNANIDTQFVEGILDLTVSHSQIENL